MLCLLTAMLHQAPAQTLAHPGWVGNGLNTDAWWQHAVFYEYRASAGQPDFKVIAAKVAGLRALGVDALLIPTPDVLSQTQSGLVNAPDPTLEDFDELIHEASRNGMRILLNLSVSATTPDVPAVTRFWLSRGIAGFRVTTSSGMSQPESDAIVQSIRRLISSAPGQRIVISDLDPAAFNTTAAPHQSTTTGRHAGRTPDGQPQFDARPAHLATFDAGLLRPLLDQTITQPTLLLDFNTVAANSSDHLANAIAAIQLTLHPIGVIEADLQLPEPPKPEPIAAPSPLVAPPPTLPPGTFVPYVPYIPPPKPATPQETPAADPLTDWYRQLSVLHHANAVLRLGSTILLNFDQQNALVWVARPSSTSLLTPPVVVLCNLSSTTVQIALGAATKGLNLHGTYLRTLLRSDEAMGPQDLNAVRLPPYAVYVGELRR